MFGGLFGRSSPATSIASSLYGAIVAQARRPALYAGLGVPDTVEGRLEMVILHAAILLRRLREGDAPAKAIGQSVFDLFCRDMDRSLRELGVGDLAVPKKMRRLGEAFYGRAAAYEGGLAGDDMEGLAAAIDRNVFAGAHRSEARALAAYAKAAATGLASVPTGALVAGHLSFPDPAAHMSLATAP
jgi:cytochrome b pre-mRNA-processing protein 3